jgi:hypothetical protein
MKTLLLSLAAIAAAVSVSPGVEARPILSELGAHADNRIVYTATCVNEGTWDGDHDLYTLYFEYYDNGLDLFGWVSFPVNWVQTGPAEVWKTCATHVPGLCRLMSKVYGVPLAAGANVSTGGAGGTTAFVSCRS